MCDSHPEITTAPLASCSGRTSTPVTLMILRSLLGPILHSSLILDAGRKASPHIYGQDLLCHSSRRHHVLRRFDYSGAALRWISECHAIDYFNCLVQATQLALE